VGAAQFRIFTHDNKEYDAEFVAGDKVSDLAVLKIKGEKFQKASFGNSNQLIFGESVVAIGRPGGSENASSVTKGIISATSRRVQTTSSYSARLIETDTPINPGSSGGALVNMYGQVIGITSSKLANEDIDAVGYAIPTTTMKRIVGELIKNGKVLSRAKLGITYQVIDSITASIKKLKYTGLSVEEVTEDSDLYGKLKSGDVITHINGISVTSDEIVLDIIEKAKAGDKMKVTYVSKDEESKTIEATLKPNMSESSYTEIETKPELNPDSSKEQGGGVFDFPFGE
jgi:serine protease Do